MQSCAVFLTNRGSQADSHRRMTPLPKTLRNASKETKLSLQASSEQQAYCKAQAKRIAFFKAVPLTKWAGKPVEIWIQQNGYARSACQGVNFAACARSSTLLLTFISSRRETGRKSSLPTGAMLSFKKTQEWKKRRTEDVLASSVHEEFKVKGF